MKQSDIARALGISASAVHQRIKAGASFEGLVALAENATPSPERTAYIAAMATQTMARRRLRLAEAALREADDRAESAWHAYLDSRRS